MNTQRPIDDIIQEMNELAKSQGRYLGKPFWEIPPQPGSLLDAPETPESKERIARLRARRLAREQRTNQPTDGQSEQSSSATPVPPCSSQELPSISQPAVESHRDPARDVGS
jgi:hypothetical protein